MTYVIESWDATLHESATLAVRKTQEVETMYEVVAILDEIEHRSPKETYKVTDASTGKSYYKADIEAFLALDKA